MKILSRFPRVILFRLFFKADILNAAPFDEELFYPGSAIPRNCPVSGFGVKIDIWDGEHVIFRPRLLEPTIVHDDDEVTIEADGSVNIVCPPVIGQQTFP